MINFVPLSDCISLFGGGTPSKQVPEYWNGKIPWASVKDLKSTRLKRTEDSITELGLKNSSSKLVKAGTIIIATRMAVGKAAIADIDVAINQDLKAIVCKENIDVQYLFYFLKSSENEFNKASSGATVKGIKLNHILDLKIPLPPLAEQKQIAAILDAADSLRQKDQQLVEHYNALRQSLFLGMFGDPVTNLMEWPKYKIEDLGVVSTGQTPSSKNNNMFNGDVPFVTPSDLDTNYPYKRTVTEEGAKKSRMVEKGALFVCCIGATIGKIRMAQELCAFNQQINAIEWSEKINPLFGFNAFFFLKTEVIKRAISTTLPILKKSEFQKIQLVTPPIELQNQFAERYQIIEKQKQQALANLQKSEALFNSLLQRAFTGELTADKAA